MAGQVTSSGYVTVAGGRVWYEVYGREMTTPLVLLHGGPGFAHYSFAPLLALAEQRTVIWYDQLGSGESDRPSGPELWQVDRFVDELATVRAALGLDEVHLLGHSWGTMLLAAYLATDPAGVASAVFSSPCLDAARWTSDAEDYIAQLPDELRQALTADLAGAEIPEELFQRALDAYYARHFCRIPWPDVVEKDFAAVNMEVYESMWGPTEFKATGCLKNFDATGWLGAINVPTLFTCGRHDEASPASTASYTARVPGARMHIFEDSAHMSFLEETPEYLRVISQFLAESDSTARLGQ